MKKVKKPMIVNFRATKELKENLEKIAEERGWSVSQLCERIVSEYINKNYPENQP